MKEIIGKVHQHKKSKLPRNLIADKKCIILETEITKKFDEFFLEIGPSLAEEIPIPSKSFEIFLKKVSTSLPEKYLTINELRNLFFCPKTKKSTGADEISSKAIKIVSENEVYF